MKSDKNQHKPNEEKKGYKKLTASEIKFAEEYDGNNSIANEEVSKIVVDPKGWASSFITPKPKDKKSNGIE
jgi:hypothetical protein